jgi:hypothetical protein
VNSQSDGKGKSNYNDLKAKVLRDLKHGKIGMRTAQKRIEKFKEEIMKQRLYHIDKILED